ncbi:MAG: nucleoside deaminase [Bacteroidota bacterium]|nr:nucleoside deaminase [Bacteroidota bacterium]
MDKKAEYFMQQALKEAQKAWDANEVPIGAVIVMQDKIIARGFNQVETLNDATAHAEIIALTSAFNFLGAKYLPDATLYVTIEPCTMCCGALYWSKIGKLVYGSSDPKHGGLSLLNSATKNINPLHPKTEIVKDILASECVILLKEFFKSKR